MSRISTCFERLRAQGRKALIPFITAGDPSPELTVPLMHALVAGGADIIELGVPFSDPMADGPVIQRSSERALAHGVSLRRVLAMVETFRRTDVTTPVVLMGYANPIEAMGYEPFARDAADAGVDGVLTVDYPPEEAARLVAVLQRHGLDAIFLLAPTTPPARVDAVTAQASGFIYYVSLKGVTGAAHLDIDAVAARLPAIRVRTGLPVGVGFGIRDPEAAQRVAQVADAVVIGSRIVQEIESSPPETVTENVRNLVAAFRNAIDTRP
ncbi:MAG: tryptophan synthase subunit alpha [Thiobacillaceae bacterium]|nr:tryptophan synthase subunit alpha [Thiobacillaceae bacterium]MDW8323149.1 tryptophan synthase subunit alpha [Burkholderiales bacterium]